MRDVLATPGWCQRVSPCFYCSSLELVEEAINLVPRVLGLFGQRVSARRDSRIINPIFPENVRSGLIAYV